MTDHTHSRASVISLALRTSAAAVALLLAGCGGLSPSKFESISSSPVAAAFNGMVHGGQQPVAYSTIALYAANPTTLQGASTPLLTATVLTSAQGNFGLTGLYSCPSPDSLLYITATGGDPGVGSNNPALAMMSILGPCSSVSSSTFTDINEISTVASAYALAPFMADATHIGAPASNAAGLARAFASINSLVDTSTGNSPGPSLPANGTAPIAELNTLADMIATCVNSSVAGNACAPLFAAAPSPAGTAPTDTLMAVHNIAVSPGANVNALYLIPSGRAPFQPVLGAAPQDWTIALRYTGGGIIAPHGIALDSGGNVWVTNEGGFTVTKLNPSGNPLSGASGFTTSTLIAPQGIAIDPTGNAWVANSGGNSIVKFDAAGNVLSGSNGFTSGIYAPVDIASDASGNAWVANLLDNSVTKLGPTGNVVAGPLNGSGLVGLPTSVALDPGGTLWVSSSSAGTLVRFASDGTLLSSAGSTDQFLQGPAQVALTASGLAFVAAPGSNTVSAFDSTGAALPASPFSSTSLNIPLATATDGANTVWLANGATTGSLTQLSAAGVALTPATGFGVLAAPLGLAIDATGSIWIANSGDDSVWQFIGLATPVSLPLASRTR